ncbi:MAG: ADP-ribosylglycohydrolase family protein [bacterium]
MSLDLIDAATGAMLGTMVGDSLGMPAEGLSRELLMEQLGRLDSLREGRLPAGEYTDDTEMTIGLCEALLERGEFDVRTVAQHMADLFTPWRGYSPHVYGIMARIRQGLDWESPGTSSWGAGAATRVAALGILYADDPLVAEHAAAQAQITHTHANGIAGAVAQAQALSIATVNGLFESAVTAEELLDQLQGPVSDHSVAMIDSLERIRDLRRQDSPEQLSAAIARVYSCDGSAVGTVPAALAAFLLSNSFEEAVIAAVNCGGDTDTLGAMTGALAGAFYGARSIPERLTAGLANEQRGRDHVISLGKKLGLLTRKRSGASLED